ncbi:hypothetical protein P175DRAFT_0501879 [Aspergillus ochraceoroseus IBT 24754]|nr:uncharacterized protein P175DRAFT_0501879 [Aspergillus ochraceoroseus IBT 24754]PTU21241.1 hypothetical protein P175DRAFT_0501879 [Aspergillus ochraceoroseus IBT 24754]
MPFHWCCFEILLRTLTGGIDPDSIKPDVLYDALSAMCNVSGSALQLDYGRDVAHAQGQYWQCIPGAEYSVKHPTNTPALSTSIQAELQGNDNLRTPYTKVNLKDRQPKSPFGKLPVEMVDKICSFLPGDSLKALIEASLFVQVITQENYFWKRFIQYDMPWLWEMQTLQARDDLPPDLNYKLVHSWLDKITTPEYGMNDSAWMGIANRRRIWNACEQVAPKYFDSLG